MAKALKLLAQIENEFGYDAAELGSKGQSPYLLEAKAAFLVWARALKIPVVTMAEVLGVTTCCISYRLSPVMQATCRRNHLRRKIAAKAVRDGLGWNVPVWSGNGYQHLYAGGQVVQARLCNV